MENNNDRGDYRVVVKTADGWRADTIGENEPRGRQECMDDILAMRAGSCGNGPEWTDADYGIRDLVNGHVEVVA